MRIQIKAGPRVQRREEGFPRTRPSEIHAARKTESRRHEVSRARQTERCKRPGPVKVTPARATELAQPEHPSRPDNTRSAPATARSAGRARHAPRAAGGTTTAHEDCADPLKSPGPAASLGVQTVAGRAPLQKGSPAASDLCVPSGGRHPTPRPGRACARVVRNLANPPLFSPGTVLAPRRPWKSPGPGASSVPSRMPPLDRGSHFRPSVRRPGG
jgi:hypothetical protein